MDEKRIINRDGISIVGFQLDGLCIALRATIPHGHKPGVGTLQILRKLRDDLKSILTSGKAIDNFPEIDDALEPIAVLALAETLRTTMLCFVTPEQAEEQRRAVGFRSER